jgi:hypothetical protein
MGALLKLNELNGNSTAGTRGFLIFLEWMQERGDSGG